MLYAQIAECKMVSLWGKEEWAKITLEIHSIPDPYFATTCEGHDWGGCNHDVIVDNWPYYAKYLRWHLTSVRKGPMHYIANALYWAGHSGYCEGGDKDPPNEKYLKSTIVYGALESDKEVDPMSMGKDELSTWLQDRFPALMKAFDHDMSELFREQYEIKEKDNV